MNERIRELALEARIAYYSKNGSYEGSDDGLSVIPSTQSLEKFAELIVRECIAQVALLGISNFENDDISWTVDMAIKNIQHRFGFEK